MMKRMTWAMAGLLSGAMAMAGAARAEIAGDAVKIGVLTDASGVYADAGGKGSLEAARMAVADFGGTVKGKKIEILYADHQNKPDVGVSIARQWFDVEHVNLITDVLTSSVAIALQSVVKEKNGVLINTGAASSDLTGKFCTPNTIHYAYDTYALAHGTGSAIVATGGDSWYFITADYAFGQALERDTTAWVVKGGGKVLGGVKAPLSTTDFSSYLLQAQSSGAKVVGLANAGQDTVNAIKQAGEFGLVASGQRLAGLLLFISDINSLGLQAAQGLTLTTGFYWDRTEATRTFSKRFYEKMKQMPSMVQAGVYSGVMNYLKAVEAIDSIDGAAVVQQMRKVKINDIFAENGYVREDGRMVHDMYLVEVKKPGDSKYPWDYYKILKVIPGEEAFRPLPESECPLVKKAQ